jgi:group I intron endonuclease
MIIYKIRNKINGKIYIGQTIRFLNSRIAEHMEAKTHIGFALRKYGIESFEIKVIGIAGLKEVANEKEKYWIKELNCKHPNGYNLTDGGEGCCGRIQTQEEKNKRSIIMTGKNKGKTYSTKGIKHGRPPGNKGKPSPLKGIKTGRSPWNKGKTNVYSLEVSNKRKAAMKGMGLGDKESEETREKKSIALKGRVKTKEHIKHIEEAKKRNRLAKLSALKE